MKNFPCKYLNITVMLTLCAITGFAGEHQGPSLGMWAWKQAAYATSESRTEMLDFCQRVGITHIDQHVSIRNNTIQHEAALATLIAEAGTCNITVNALRGEQTMFFKTRHEQTRAELETIVTFNNALPPDSKLKGIKFDVEPYLTPEWKAGGEQQKQIIRSYLEFLKQAKLSLQTTAPELELAVDVPFWWDKPAYQIEFDGEQKPFIHHIQDQVDWIGIMSYRRDSSQITRLVQDEMEYAKSKGLHRSVAPALETSHITGPEADISFGEVPSEQFLTTLSELRQTFAGNRQLRCIMLHHYSSLRTYLRNVPDTSTAPENGVD